MSATNTGDGDPSAAKTAFPILAAISVCHLLNDMMQSLLPAIYPMLKRNYGLDFGQIGVLTFTFQFTASVLQPMIGFYTDRRPLPYSLPAGMGFTLSGLVLLAYAHNYTVLLLAAALIGIGSAVLHPESSRVARMASGGRHGLAQSLFQVIRPVIKQLAFQKDDVISASLGSHAIQRGPEQPAATTGGSGAVGK